MAKKILYYYSLDGKETLGPVEADEIRKLAGKRILTRAGFIRAEGVADWQPWDPVSMSRLGELPRESGRPVKKVKPRKVRDDGSGGGFLSVVLNLAALVMGIRGLIIWMIAPPPLPPPITENAGAFGVLGAGAVALIIAPSVVAACFFQGSLRVFMRTAGIVGLSLWMAHLHPSVFNANAGLYQQIQQSVSTMQAKGQKPVGSKGSNAN